MPAEAALIYDAIRTPRGKGRRDGALHEFKPVSILTSLLRTMRDRNGLEANAVGDVVMGVVNPLGEQGSVVAKTAAQLADLGQDVCGLQVNRFCASGLEAIAIAANRAAAGHHDLTIAGGVESMSRVPMGSDGGPWLEDPETAFATDFVPQGISADLISSIGGYSRQQVDAFAMQSHDRASRARREGAFTSIVPFHDAVGLHVLSHDELVRESVDPSAMAKLEPSFASLGSTGFDDIALSRYPNLRRVDHVHTAGNSSGIADGASAVLIGSAEAGRRHGLKPRARIVATALAGTDPTLMLTGPGPATQKLLRLTGLTPEDIDLYEVNEAFAAVVLRFLDDVGVSDDRVNVNGGAIAMGHPLGATGGMLVGTLLDELERRSAKRGIVTLCVGGGMGIATLIERI